MKLMNLEERLREATQEPILSELKGAMSLFAVTPSELIYVGPKGVQRAPLREVKRVASAKGGKLIVAGKDHEFIEASIGGFDLGELKLFFESVKTYVAKAKRGELLDEAPPPPEPEPEPEPPPPPPPPAPPEPEPELDADPPPLVPEEEEELPPLPPEPEDLEDFPQEAYEDEELPVAEPPRRRSPLRIPLKILALLTLAYTAAFYFLYPDTDPWLIGGVILGGLGLALAEWQAAEV